ncbi:phosphohydrolase [Oscillospiraceae bacterium]|nr:phosphohydrolase [Oscillospiraceae bacterium]
MDRAEFQAIEGYMLQQMADMAHDAQHVYRVFYTALDIAGRETEARRDIVAAAALLHDVGRAAQARDPALCHAQVGAEMAYRFLTRELGWDEGRAGHVRACVLTHRFRSDRPPESLEAKIVFDADKLDVTGAIGVARTLMYGGQVGQGLYRLDQDGRVLTEAETAPSFFREYNFKLRGIAGGLYTRRARELARGRQKAADAFYDALLEEVTGCLERGRPALDGLLRETGDF